MAVVASAVLLAVAACGGGGDDDTEAGEQFTTEDVAVEKVPDAQGPAPAVPDAQEGGTITVLHPDPDDGPSSLDPTAGWSVTDNGILQGLVFRSLTTFRRNAETGGMELVPDLATDLGTTNEDNTEWTFTIKDDVTWEDGSPVTADDVAFGIKRSFDTASVEGPGAVYSKGYFLNGADYEGPYVSGEDYEGVVVDGQEITIKMEKPFPDMDYWGAFAAIGPVPSGKAGEPPAYGLDPMATGPYKVQSFTPNQELVLERNENWNPDSDAARNQYVDEWVFKFDQNPETTDALMLSNNEESQTTINTIVSGTKYQEAVDALGDRVVVEPQTCTYFDYPDYEKITDINIRRAIAFAYDYENVWAAGGDIPGTTRTMGNSILPPGMGGHDDEMEPIPGETIEFNPDKAKEYLAEAGVEPGEYELSFAYDDSTQEGKDAMAQKKRGFEESGFTVKPYPYSEGSLYDVWTDPNNNINQKINIKGVAWCQDWPSALTFIPPLFQSGELYNTGLFSEQAVDDMIEEIPTMELDEQADAWGELDRMIMQEYFPVVITGYSNNLWAYGESIGNFTNDSAQGYPNLRDMYVMQ